MAQRKRTFEKGFTLIEVMAVLLIIGLLAGVAVKNFLPNIARSKVVQTKANLRILHEGVIAFYMDTGRYPSDEEGLLALVEEPTDAEGWASGGYLDSTQLPKDGWNNDFYYMTEPGNGKPFVVISFGADGEEGGEDDSADLWSTDAN